MHKNELFSSMVAGHRKLPTTLLLELEHHSSNRPIHSFIESGLMRIGKISDCNHAALMLLDTSTSSLNALKLYSQGQIIDGEECIFLKNHSPLQKMIEDSSKILKVDNGCVYFLIHFYDQPVGVLRLDKNPVLRLDEEQKSQIVELLNDFGVTLWNFLLNSEIKEQEDHLTVLSAIHNAVSQSLDTENLMIETVKTIQNVFGINHVRIYLLDTVQKMLNGQVSCDFRGRISSITDENLPLKPGTHPAVDCILDHHVIGLRNAFSSVMCTFLLRAKDENFGVLMIDNLLSQEEITEEMVQLLEMVSGQIGMAIKNARLFHQVMELSITDGLTGLYIPRYFHQRIHEEFERARRQSNPLSLAILDLDHFKEINDSCGHLMGDKALKIVAAKIVSSTRKFDIAVRYGGDEFIMLMPGSNELDALRTIERVLKSVEESPIQIDAERKFYVTLSVGIASFPNHAGSDEELLQNADNALYEAKRSGRNRIVIYSQDNVKKV